MLAPHLHPKTYWEQRCELFEQAVVELLKVISEFSPPIVSHDLSAVVEQWNRNLKKLTDQFPPPPES